VNRIEKIRWERTEARKRTINEAFRLLSARFSPIGVALKPFGSYAEGKIHAGSDLDLAISGPDLPSDVKRAVIREAERISAELGVGIDLVFEAESPLFYDEVKNACPV
jgi:predicted nucleotidyltransferase